MPNNIRVYELARELGMTNAETLDLAESLGIGVKSHSSSIVDAQADRVRRKAEREGLVRDEQPEEPKPVKKAAKKAAKKATAKKAAASVEAPADDTDAEEAVVAPDPVIDEPTVAAEPVVVEPTASESETPAAPARVISSSGSAAPPKKPTAPEDAPAPVAKKVVK